MPVWPVFYIMLEVRQTRGQDLQLLQGFLGMKHTSIFQRFEKLSKTMGQSIEIKEIVIILIYFSKKNSRSSSSNRRGSSPWPSSTKSVTEVDVDLVKSDIRDLVERISSTMKGKLLISRKKNFFH